MKIRRRELVNGISTSLILVSGCLSGSTEEQPRAGEFSISSSSFYNENSSNILKYRHTRQGDNVSPSIQLHNLPNWCDRVAVALRDVTGSTEIPLWLLWGRIPTEDRFPAKISKTSQPDSLSSITQGTNDLGEVGYSGPDLHREYDSRDSHDNSTAIELTVFVFESKLNIDPDSSYNDLIQALNKQRRSSTSIFAKVASGPIRD